MSSGRVSHVATAITLVCITGSCTSLRGSAGRPLAPAPVIDVVELTADRIQADYARRAYTAVQLTQAFLHRISRYEDYYNAFISMNPDALAIAADLDRAYARTG